MSNDLTDIFGDEELEEGSELALALYGPVSWSPKMAFDIAMGATDTECMQRYEITPAEYARIISHPAFRKEVNGHIKDVRENGVTFKAKAKIQAEEYLEVLDGIINDQGVGVGLRIDAIKSVVKWAGHDAPPAAAGAGTGQNINIQINL